MGLPAPYSFKDLAGTFVHPLAGTFTFRGQQGLGQITITNSTDRSAQDVSADGAVMVSYIAGDNGTAALEMQQTSPLHKFMLAWYNLCKTAADNGDISAWASAEMHLRTIVGGQVFNLIGISPSKAPDQPFAAQGQKITWSLMVADLQRA